MKRPECVRAEQDARSDARRLYDHSHHEPCVILVEAVVLGEQLQEDRYAGAKYRIYYLAVDAAFTRCCAGRRRDLADTWSTRP